LNYRAGKRQTLTRESKKLKQNNLLAWRAVVVDGRDGASRVGTLLAGARAADGARRHFPLNGRQAEMTAATRFLKAILQ